MRSSVSITIIITVAFTFWHTVVGNFFLPELRWQNRVLIFRAESEALLSAFEDQLQVHREEVRDRKLLVISTFESSLKFYGLGRTDEVRDLSQGKLLELLGDFDAVLIGLDGGVKARYTSNNYSWTDLFARIDGMPMRRAELEARNSSP